MFGKFAVELLGAWVSFTRLSDQKGYARRFCAPETIDQLEETYLALKTPGRPCCSQSFNLSLEHQVHVSRFLGRKVPDCVVSRAKSRCRPTRTLAGLLSFDTRRPYTSNTMIYILARISIRSFVY
jgi:hypothetical protein